MEQILHAMHNLEPTESWFVQQALIAHGVKFSLGLFSSELTRFARFRTSDSKTRPLRCPLPECTFEDNRP